MVNVICDVPSDDDDTGADGIWDLAGEITDIAWNSAHYNDARYRIYKKLRGRCEDD